MNHSALHSVFQSNQSNNQQSNFESVQSGKKKKKQKMVRADPSLLGEHRHAASAECWEGAGHSGHCATAVAACFQEGKEFLDKVNFFNQLWGFKLYILLYI